MMKRFYSFLYIIIDINNSSSPNWSNSRRGKKKGHFSCMVRNFLFFFLDAHNVGARDVNILHYYQQQMPLLYLSYVFSTR